MGPKKKKNPKNDFFFFMQDYKNELRRQGRSYKDMADLANICGPIFAQLSDEEKQIYKNQAKEWKKQDKFDLSNKFDHQGRSLQDIKDEETARETFLKSMKDRIDETISTSFSNGTLVKQKFFFIHFNTLCTTNEGIHLPCEMGLIEFSLSSGVSRYIHTFICPPEIPLGYSYDIQRISNETHKINLDLPGMQDKAAKSYSWIVRNMLKMLCEDGDTKDMPPLYTLPSEEEKTKCILDDLFSWAGYASPKSKNLFVYHADQLFFRLSKEMPEMSRLPSKGYALTKLEEEKFLYSLDVGCFYHEEVDRSRFCSLFAVKKLAFIIAERCCFNFGIDSIPGRHVPPDIAVNPPIPREDPIQIKIATQESWKVDESLKSEPEVNMFGHKITKATPAGYSFIPQEATPQWETVRKEDVHKFYDRDTEVQLPLTCYQKGDEEEQGPPPAPYEFPSLAGSNSKQQQQARPQAPQPFHSAWTSQARGWGSQTNQETNVDQSLKLQSCDEFPTLGGGGASRRGRGSSRGVTNQMGRMKL